MLTIFSSLRDFTFQAVALRMVLAVFCGGLIGLERTFRRRPAGMRTHMLICLGASMTTLTSQYLLLYMNYYTDMARLGAQVVAGIGFIGGVVGVAISYLLSFILNKLYRIYRRYSILSKRPILRS